MKQSSNISIIGAGPAGLSLASLLQQQGYNVSIFERNLNDKTPSGRSINLALSTRSFAPLSALGLLEQVKAISVTMFGRTIHNFDGSEHYQPYSPQQEDCLYSISRNSLNDILLQEAYSRGVEINHGTNCLNIDIENNTLYLEGNGIPHTVIYDYLIGADGINSKVRSHILNANKIDESEIWAHQIETSYIEFILPKQSVDALNMNRTSFHIWPRTDGMIVGLPNIDESLTCTLFWNSKALYAHKGKLNKLFVDNFPQLVHEFPYLADSMFSPLVSALKTIKCRPWVYKNILLVGDAAHAVVPFYGQGVNASLEDGILFVDSLHKHEFVWEKAALDFSHKRKLDTDALADIALEHYYELQDKVKSKLFLIKNRILQKLQKLSKGWYLTDYSTITFTNQPYSKVIVRKAKIERILNAIKYIAPTLFIGGLLWIIANTYK